ncbi:Hpt domain-containing protein, partial [Candidatus Regiella insecticola]
LATQFQLERDIPLLPQSVAPKPMLDLTDHQLSKKIKQALLMLVQKITESIDDTSALLHHLHTLKGCAGQAGLTELQNNTAELETCLHAGGAVTKKEVETLYQLISFHFDDVMNTTADKTD